MHATRIRPDTRPTDVRRLAAAGLSAVLPGLGQMFNGRTRLAALFLIPSLILLLLVALLVGVQSPARLAAWVVSPQVLGALMTLNGLVLAWRLLAAGQAFLDTRRAGPTGRLGIVGIVVIALFVAIPHLAIYRYGTVLGETFDRIFTSAVLGASTDREGANPLAPREGERINVLLVGVDKRRDHLAPSLTDTMMVASIDPVGHTVSLVSLPRDLIDTPLGDGDTYGPKLNSLMAYADAHPGEFPNGGLRTLQDAVGALLEIPIHYHGQLDFGGFITMIDAVGGVDIIAPRAFEDPTYDGYGVGEKGFSITAGPHHLDGVHALAYARSRKAVGESDFTRQARQQQILVALRDEVTRGGSLLFQLPGLLEGVGETIRTDIPVARLPDLAGILDEIGKDDVTSVVIRAPLVKTKRTQFGDSQAPNLTRIRAMASELFSEPGVDPVPWPTPKPTKAPKATPGP